MAPSPPALAKAVGAVGEVVDTSVGTGQGPVPVAGRPLRDGPVRLDGPAAARLAEHLGEDMGRLAGLLDTLAAAYGEGATVTAPDLEPFLGEAGSLAPWDLTDAIDAGDTARALGCSTGCWRPGLPPAGGPGHAPPSLPPCCGSTARA